MKKVLVSVTAAAALSSFAMAGGDIAPVAPAPTDSWSGFYMGLQAGYSWGDADHKVEDEGNPIARTSNIDVDGPLAGFYAGYNWLLSDGGVVGVEAEWNYLYADGKKHPLFDGDDEPYEGVDIKVKQEWDASLRLRAGMLMGDYLPYITGGIAAAGVNLKHTEYGYTYFDDDQIMVGWTIGAGVEMAISENVHARLQYRYTDYGDEDFDTPSPSYFFPDTVNVDYNAHMLTVGLSYRF